MRLYSLNQPSDQIIVQGLGDFNAAEIAGIGSISFDIIDENDAVDARCLRFKAPLPQQISFLRLAFHKQRDTAYPNAAGSSSSRCAPESA